MRPSQAALPPAQPAGRDAAVLRGDRERAVFAALAVLALAAVFLNRWGWVTPDTDPQLYYAPGRTLIRALFAWRSDPFLGHRNFNAGLAPTAAVVLLIRALGASVWVTIRILRAGLLLLAGWGAVRLFHHVSRQPDRSAGRLTACVLYVANPYVVLSGASLPVLLPYALFPWMLLAFARSIERPRSWRWPAAFALAFFSMGGMNAGVVPLYLLLGVPSYLLYSKVGEQRQLRAMAAPTAKCFFLLMLVSVYWVIPALLARGAGIAIASTTERPADISSTSSYSESLRLIGLWPLYGRQGNRLFMPNAVSYVTNPLVVVATFAIPLMAALSAVLSKARARLLAAMLLVVGTPIMVGLFPPQSPSPFGRVLNRLFVDVPGALGFRTTNKVGALVALGLALLIGLGAAEATRRSTLWPIGARAAALGLVAVIVGVSVFPAWSGKLYASGWKGIPAYWQRAAGDLNAGSSLTRVLLLPGEEFADYRWGKSGPADLNESLLSRPSAIRVTIPAGSAYAANFMAALDQPLNALTYRKGGLPTMARYLGARDVLVRNDMKWEEWGGARPSVLAGEIKEPGLRLVQSYGPLGLYTTAPAAPAPPGSLGAEDRRLPPLQRYVVVAPRPVVRAEPVAATVLLDGDNFGLAALPSLGLLPGAPPFRLLGSMSLGDLRAAIDDGARIVLTDSNRRRAWTFRSTGVDHSATLGPDQILRPGGDLTFRLFGDDPDAQTVSLLEGAASVTASGYGSAFAPIPWNQPAFAFDGDRSTAWLAGGYGAAVGQHITIRFSHPVGISQLELQQALGRGRQIAAVRLNLGGRVFVEDLPARPLVRITLPPTSARFLSVEVARIRGTGSNSVGFREIGIPGVKVTQVTRLPLTFSRLAARLQEADLVRLLGLPMDVVMIRQAGRPAARFDEEEPVFRRQFTLPQARSFTFTGTLSLAENLSDPELDRLAGVARGIVADSSSRRGPGVGNRASAALDGDPNTAWIPALRGPGAYLDVSFPGRVLDHVVVRQDVPRGGVRASFISQAGLSIDGRPPLPVELGPQPTTIHFPPTKAHRLRLTVRRVSGLGGPITISELQIKGVRVGRTDPTTPVKGCVPGFSVDGRPYSIELPGTLGRLTSLSPFQLSSCAQQSMQLAAGPHRIDSIPGWNVDMLHLSSPGVSRPTTSVSAAPKVAVVDSSPTRMSLTASAAIAPYYLVPGVAYDPRWSATMDGKPLGPPVVVDGYSVGWRITDRRPHSFQVGFDPQRSLTLSLALSVAGVALALILLVRGRRET